MKTIEERVDDLINRDLPQTREELSELIFEAMDIDRDLIVEEMKRVEYEKSQLDNN
jgi:hypothetical protein